jgi:raffinose/stachyose/melibiose transport system permease protein
MTGRNQTSSTAGRAEAGRTVAIKSRRLPGIVKFALMTLLALVVLTPIYYLVVSTFKTGAEIVSAPMALPSRISLDRYVEVFNKMHYPRVFANTAFITVLSVTGTILCASMAGYALNRKSRSKIASSVFMLLLSGLMFPGQMGIMGLYKVVSSLGLMNTHWALILINIAGGLPFATFLFHAFTSTIPVELEEAARIDGAGTFRTFFTIVFPLLKPVVFTVGILNALSVWNDFMGPMYFLQKREKQVILQEVYRNVGQFSTNWEALFPMMLLGVLPMIIFYVFTQRHIVGGVMAGSLKG